MNELLTVAFVVAVVAFLKEQFLITGKVVLIYAFVICLFVAIAPLIAQAVPGVQPWLDVIVKTFVLFLGAAGSWDAVRQLIKKQTK